MGITWVLLAAVVLAGCGGQAPAPEQRSAFDLSAGDCLNNPQGGRERLGDVDVVPCDQPHELEVFAVLSIPAGPEAAYPGDAELNAFAEPRCRGAAFREYVGIPKSRSQLLVMQATPAQETWIEGDREVICLLHRGDEPLEQSMKDSET